MTPNAVTFFPLSPAQCASQIQPQENNGCVVLYLELARLEDSARNNEK